MEETPLPLLALLSFGCEYINASLGMGYGTTLTPILLILGYPPSVIVPTVLLSGLFTGLISGGFHHAFGNLSLKKGSRDRGVIAVLASMGMIGSAAAVFTATSLSNRVIEIYIGAMVLLMGILVYVFRNHRLRFSFPRILAIGAVAAFNKGISGGGYGPLVVSGQILSGHGVRNAVGIACLTEGLICAIGFPLYLGMNDGTAWFTENWMLFVPVLVGAVLAAPIASWTTRVIVRRVDLRVVIALITSVLGAWTLWDTLLRA
jgi:uncharacterized membrane protein YfcA